MTLFPDLGFPVRRQRRSASHNYSIFHEAVRYTVCPFCKADKGVPCRNTQRFDHPHANEAAHTHVARVNAYNRRDD